MIVTLVSTLLLLVASSEGFYVIAENDTVNGEVSTTDPYIDSGDETGNGGDITFYPADDTGIFGDVAYYPVDDRGIGGNISFYPGDDTGIDGDITFYPVDDTGIGGDISFYPGNETVSSGEACYSKDTPYMGDLSWTVTGKSCQHWVLDCPHEHEYHSDSMFPDGSQENANNFCRSPDGEKWPWCYTTDPNVEWEYCPVKACDKDCYDEGSDYSGLVAHTLSGRICQAWTSDYPHEHSYHYDTKYPEGSQVEASNYCRNPRDDFHPPWCFTTDPDMRWEYCDVKKCDTNYKDVNSGDHCFSEGSHYTGHVAHTIRGFTCQMWKSNSPHKHSYHKNGMFPDKNQVYALNFCRDPSGSGWPWCFTTSKRVRWDYCYVEACNDECFNMSSPYAGPLKHTVGGYECQRWASDHPHEHTFHDDIDFPDGSQKLAKNYCRNPDGKWPWCYTTDPDVRWDYCPVKGCYAQV